MHFRIAVIGFSALAAVLVAAFALGKPTPAPTEVARPASPPPDVRIIPLTRGKPFEEKWLDAGLAIKADRLSRPSPIVLETVAAIPPKPMQLIDEVQEAQEKKPKPTRVAHDICRGKGKIYSKNGKSWKCRR